MIALQDVCTSMFAWCVIMLGGKLRIGELETHPGIQLADKTMHMIKEDAVHGGPAARLGSDLTSPPFSPENPDRGERLILAAARGDPAACDSAFPPPVARPSSARVDEPRAPHPG